MHLITDKQTDRQTGKQGDTHTDRLHKQREMDVLTSREAQKTDRPIEIQIDRQTDRETKYGERNGLAGS